ncbi:hypothetical protein GQ457_09G015970 [Hibiscus cannabinus]
MPKSIFMKSGMGIARPTTVILQLADRSHVRPEVKVEDLLVKVGKFVFPADFLILDCEADHKAPIILARPFLATRRILIDCEKGGFTMRVGDQTMTINVYNTIRYMDNGEECHSLQDSIATSTTDDTELCYNNFIQIKDFMHLQEEDQEEIQYFEDDDAKARHQTLKGRQTLAEKGFVFKWTSKEGFPASVMATIAMHKWEKFVTHPGSVDPHQKPINVTLVQEFYAHLTSPTQSSVYVRGEQIQLIVAKINKFYGLQNTTDNHSKFVSGLKGKSNDFLLDRLKPDGKLWMHFIKQSLMPISHTATASLSRLQLLHSNLNGRFIDVWKIIMDEAYACLTMKLSPLLFPHLITALCRKKGVFESPEDLQKKGRLGITADNIPSLMGFDEAATSKQPTRGARTIAAAKLAALITKVETTRDQPDGLKTCWSKPKDQS